MDKGYIDKGNLSSVNLANMDFIYWSLRSFSRMGEEGIKEFWVYRYFLFISVLHYIWKLTLLSINLK